MQTSYLASMSKTTEPSTVLTPEGTIEIIYSSFSFLGEKAEAQRA